MILIQTDQYLTENLGISNDEMYIPKPNFVSAGTYHKELNQLTNVLQHSKESGYITKEQLHICMPFYRHSVEQLNIRLPC